LKKASKKKRYYGQISTTEKGGGGPDKRSRESTKRGLKQNTRFPLRAGTAKSWGRGPKPVTRDKGVETGRVELGEVFRREKPEKDYVVR